MFITFEGIDGCGKSTQITRLSTIFRDSGKEVVTMREPGGTDFSEQIREILLSKKFDLEPAEELLLFEAARANLVNKIIKPALAEGKIVLSDRFYDSTTAYQGYGRQLPLEYVELCNKLATGGLKPDITFFLDVPLDIAKERSFNRMLDRMENSGSAFYERARKGFFKIADAEPERIIIIDSSGTIEETGNKITEQLVIRNIL